MFHSGLNTLPPQGHRPLRIGLTGGIGSGKSTVAQVFAVLGIPVFNADAVAKHLMNSDASIRQQLTELFGEATYENGLLNTKYLAEKVFTDSYQLQRLNAIVHPVTIAEAEAWFAEQSSPYAVKEAALLFEAGTAAGLDMIVGIYAPEHLRIHRVIQRDNTTREQVLQRMHKQIDEAIKMKLCDVVFVNDEQELLVPQVVRFHNRVLQLLSEGET